MTTWQYAQLIVYDGGMVTKSDVLGGDITEHQWDVRWIGPDGTQEGGQVASQGSAPIGILNAYGRRGWDVIDASHVGDKFEYLLKRPVIMRRRLR